MKDLIVTLGFLDKIGDIIAGKGWVKIDNNYLLKERKI
jgi:hypothetical protein